MTPAALLDFLRRELMPTPGRAGATLRLTLACLAATIPIMTHRIPHGLIVMIVMYLITQEDTAATLLGSILGVVGVTISLGMALLAWEISLDIPWLRICFLALFLYGGLFLKRVLTIGALGSAIGLPAALVMIIPDVFPPQPELQVEFVLWIWWCVVLGLSVNLAVQFLLSRGDPLTLLKRDLDTRLRAVARALRRLGGEEAGEPVDASLRSLSIAGMTRPLALLKTSAIIHRWARERHEGLAALITLVDRLVADAVALEEVAAASTGGIDRERVLRAAGGCDLLRRAFEAQRLPAPGEWTALVDEKSGRSIPLLTDLEGTLDQIALAAPLAEPHQSGAEVPQAEKRSLFLPDAFDNLEYVRFAIKGALSALICYLAFIGFDYPGIYTSVITCFVVSLSTIGASNQKGILRFGGAAVGGGMGLFALMYLFPNLETISGFWLVFGAGTAVAAWVNFGTPRISYGGYQVGLAFYKAVLQGFGPALSATVVRDRLIGVLFGLSVFGIVEHLLWPVRAADRMRERLADLLRSLSGLALACTGTEPAGAGDLDQRRRLISQQVADVQGYIESSKFEPGAGDAGEVERLTADAQSVFLVLLALARDEGGRAPLPDAVRESARRFDAKVAASLAAVAESVQHREAAPAPEVGEALAAFEEAVSACAGLLGDAGEAWRARLALYRELVAAIKRLALNASIPTLEEPLPLPA